MTQACSDYLKKETQNFLYFEAVSLLNYNELGVLGSSGTNGRIWLILLNPLDMFNIYARKLLPLDVEINNSSWF